jgi:putative ABC transport system permease protein
VGALVGLVGVYGLVAHQVGQRRREFGIMRAIGARPIDILRRVGTENARMLATGVPLGLVLAGLMVAFLRAYFRGLWPFDWFSYLVVPAAVMVACGAAACLPVRRAMRKSPAEALRV